MGNIKFTFTLKGEVVHPKVGSVRIVNQVNRIPRAEIILSEDSDAFAADTPIELAAGQHKFTGVVSEKQKMVQQNRLTYKVCLSHGAIKMSNHRRSRVFDLGLESEILKSLVSEYSLKFDDQQLGGEKQQLVQHECSDWDFLLCRAEANGRVVVVDGDTIVLAAPEVAGPGAAKVLDGASIQSLQVHSFHQQAIKSVAASMHNRDDQLSALSHQAADQAGRIKHQLEPAATTHEQQQYAGIHGSAAEVKAWAEGTLMREQLGRVRGCLELDGAADIRLLQQIEVANISEIQTTSVVTAIEHCFTAEGLRSVVTFGLSPSAFADLHRVHTPPARNLLPGINGLQLGRVDKVEENAERKDRIRVLLPHISDEKPLWARCLFSAAGDQRGVFFTPEVGDEVLIGFLNDDPRHAVVLGSLYPHPLDPPFALNSTDNFDSGIVTKSGLTLHFHDQPDKERIRLLTPGADEKDPEKEANSITLQQEADHGIALQDRFDNRLVMNKDGFLFAEKKDDGNKITMDKSGIAVRRGNNTLVLSDDKIELKVGAGVFTLTEDSLTIAVGGSSLSLGKSGDKLASKQAITVDSKGKLVLKGPGGIDMN